MDRPPANLYSNGHVKTVEPSNKSRKASNTTASAVRRRSSRGSFSDMNLEDLEMFVRVSQNVAEDLELRIGKMYINGVTRSPTGEGLGALELRLKEVNMQIKDAQEKIKKRREEDMCISDEQLAQLLAAGIDLDQETIAANEKAEALLPRSRLISNLPNEGKLLKGLLELETTKIDPPPSSPSHDSSSSSSSSHLDGWGC